MINNYSMNPCEQNVIWAYLYAYISDKVTTKVKNENINRHHPARHDDAGNAGGFEQNVTTECVPDAGPALRLCPVSGDTRLNSHIKEAIPE